MEVPADAGKWNTGIGGYDCGCAVYPPSAIKLRLLSRDSPETAFSKVGQASACGGLQPDPCGDFEAINISSAKGQDNSHLTYGLGGLIVNLLLFGDD
jgi:hypothetical protein